MIVKSARKKDSPIDIKFNSKDGTTYSLERKSYIKYLGVLIDDTMPLKHHISYICSRISRNTGIISLLYGRVSKGLETIKFKNLTAV